jgi:hypothetical protein
MLRKEGTRLVGRTVAAAPPDHRRGAGGGAGPGGGGAAGAGARPRRRRVNGGARGVARPTPPKPAGDGAIASTGAPRGGGAGGAGSAGLRTKRRRSEAPDRASRRVPPPARQPPVAIDDRVGGGRPAERARRRPARRARGPPRAGPPPSARWRRPSAPHRDHARTLGAPAPAQAPFRRDEGPSTPPDAARVAHRPSRHDQYICRDDRALGGVGGRGGPAEADVAPNAPPPPASSPKHPHGRRPPPGCRRHNAQREINRHR